MGGNGTGCPLSARITQLGLRRVGRWLSRRRRRPAGMSPVRRWSTTIRLDQTSLTAHRYSQPSLLGSSVMSVGQSLIGAVAVTGAGRDDRVRAVLASSTVPGCGGERTTNPAWRRSPHPSLGPSAPGVGELVGDEPVLEPGVSECRQYTTPTEDLACHTASVCSDVSFRRP